jgi:hypothetical protein
MLKWNSLNLRHARMQRLCVAFESHPAGAAMILRDAPGYDDEVESCIPVLEMPFRDALQDLG